MSLLPADPKLTCPLQFYPLRSPEYGRCSLSMNMWRSIPPESTESRLTRGSAPKLPDLGVSHHLKPTAGGERLS